MKKPPAVLLCMIVLSAGLLETLLHSDPAATKTQIEQSILKLKQVKNIEELSQAFTNNSLKFSIPARLLVAMAYKESCFKLKARGDHGRSWGLIQTGKQARRACKSTCGKWSDTRADVQICYGACWLAKGRLMCGGDLKQALTAYACGECKTFNPHVKWTVNSRLKLWNELEK